jgi:hypothetical protein
MTVDKTQYAIIYVNHQQWKAIKSAKRTHDMYNTGIVQPETEDLYPVVAFEGGDITVRATKSCPSLIGPTERASRQTIKIVVDNTSYAEVTPPINELFKKLAEGYIIDNTLSAATRGSTEITIGLPIPTMPGREFVILSQHEMVINGEARTVDTIRSAEWEGRFMPYYISTVKKETEEKYPMIAFDSIGIQVRTTAECPPLSRATTDPKRRTTLSIPKNKANMQLYKAAIDVLYDMLNEGHIIDTALSQDKQDIVMEKPTTYVGADALRVLERLVTVLTE